MNNFTIHPQLLAECHLLGHYPLCHLLLHKNAGVPWFILVPEVETGDLLDLDATTRNQILDECEHVARYVKRHLHLPKLNLAQLGNQVPQMHIHLIGRHPDDACWPLPVWGNLLEGGSYSEEQLEQLRMHLAAGGPFV